MKHTDHISKLVNVLSTLGVLGVLLLPGITQAEGNPLKGDIGRGAKAWVENCTRCHNVRDPKELRDDQWLSTTLHMRIRGGLTGQETRDILTFLQASN